MSDDFKKKIEDDLKKKMKDTLKKMEDKPQSHMK
jgi:hypothetical protein